ncbi:transglycosylase domain-containing protein [Robertkochia sediminum]|uniref:transglycosylase domain-containing protein n=1 Tax=Robertkochia sediminum TaxID=2785326 RepID=UPI001934B242|nr:transglycosylase domain-containing protein [Robertkochia sediminum]MBL7473530.1 transglycosylase domain-containing protein [Robertkochia sediminum]
MKWRFPGNFKKILAIFLGSLFFLSLLFLISVFSGFWGPLPGKKALASKNLDLATVLVDHHGQTIGKLFREDRIPISIEDMPPHLLEALVATEDARFYEHSGTDTKSLFRVFIKTIVLQNASSGGGSTLTQQLAKNLYGRERSGNLALVAHKIRESVIASRLEELYTKEELLEKYLNTVSFPDNTYGIESASRRFFSKPAAALTLPEAAALIGSLKATHTYNPRLFPERNMQRRNVVLHQMLKYGKIDEASYLELSEQPLILELNSKRITHDRAAYFREQVRKELEAWVATFQKENGEEIDLYRDGLIIKTTLDLDMQVMAEESVKQHMESLQKVFEASYGKRAPWDKNTTLAKAVIKESAPYKKWAAQGWPHQAIMDSLEARSEKQIFTWQGTKKRNLSTTDSLLHYLKLINVGWVSLDPPSGAVRTWIGGIDYDHIQYDHVVQSKRQVGSVFKPIVYATAIEQGIPACTYYDLRKIAYKNLGGWTPENASEKDDKKYMNYSMEYALSRSVNTVSVKVMEDAGIPNVISTARNMGISSPLPPVPSLALGTAELSVLEVARAYTAFVNNGIPSDPYFIEEITTNDGKVLFTREPQQPNTAAFSKRTAQTIREMLRSVVREGTASRLAGRYGIHAEIAGKTGTTQNNKDGWFVGFNPGIVSVSWVGLDDQRLGFNSTAIGQGANSALPLFALWWQQLEDHRPSKALTTAKFETPEAEVLEALDCKTEKRDGFFKRLFKNPNKTRNKDFKGIPNQGK